MVAAMILMASLLASVVSSGSRPLSRDRGSGECHLSSVFLGAYSAFSKRSAVQLTVLKAVRNRPSATTNRTSPYSPRESSKRSMNSISSGARKPSDWSSSSAETSEPSPTGCPFFSNVDAPFPSQRQAPQKPNHPPGISHPLPGVGLLLSMSLPAEVARGIRIGGPYPNAIPQLPQDDDLPRDATHYCREVARAVGSPE